MSIKTVVALFALTAAGFVTSAIAQSTPGDGRTASSGSQLTPSSTTTIGAGMKKDGGMSSDAGM